MSINMTNIITPSVKQEQRYLFIVKKEVEILYKELMKLFLEANSRKLYLIF